MALIKKLFPLSFRSNSAKDVLISVLIYIFADVVCGLVIGFLGALPIIGLVFNIIGGVLGLYFFVGIVISVLVFLNILK